MLLINYHLIYDYVVYFLNIGSKHQASVNDIENTDQKHSDTAKSSYHDWSSEENKANKGNLMFMTLLLCDLI